MERRTYGRRQFEQDDQRVIVSSGFGNANASSASSGTYAYGSAAVAWFPFTGDSVALQTVNYSNGGTQKLFVDGKLIDHFNIYATTSTTDTIALDGLGAGPHILQVSSYLNNATIDRFTAPAVPPFYTPITPTGVLRYEEDDPASNTTDLAIHKPQRHGRYYHTI